MTITSNSIRERILLAAMNAVRQSAEKFGATLHRSPTVAMRRDQCPALVLFPESETVTERCNDRVTRELTLRMVALARTVPPIAPETEADKLLTAAHAALTSDSSLTALVLAIREYEVEWEIEDADAVAAAIPARYRITYRTYANDLTTLG